MRRLLLVLAVLAGAVVGTASPAQAHSTTYCGHGVHWHAGSRAEFVNHYNEVVVGPAVIHWHTVAVHTWSGGLVFHKVRC